VAQAMFDKVMAVTVPVGQILASCADFRKMFAEGCKVNRIPITLSSIETQSTKIANTLMTRVMPVCMAPVVELDIRILGICSKIGLYNCGSELVCISEAAAKELKLPYSMDMTLNMRDTNGGVWATYGLIENLQLVIGLQQQCQRMLYQRGSSQKIC